jgi:hypothetical protein
MNNHHYSSFLELSPVTCPGQESKQKYKNKNKKQEQHFSSVVTNYSSMVTFLEQEQKE